MALYDSSAIIDYLDGDEDVVEYISINAGKRAITIPLVMFEVYQGEIHRSDETDLNGLDRAVQWLQVVDSGHSDARRAAAVLDSLRDAGEPLAARDALIAGTAAARDEVLVATDADFDSDALRREIDVQIL